MKNVVLSTVALALGIVLLVGFSIEMALFADMSSAPSSIQPGDEVVVLSGQTVLIDGQPCQLNWAGFVSPTSPEGTQSWYKPVRWLFPTYQMISVVYIVDGTTKWVDSSLVVKPSADHLLCPSQ